MAKELEVEETKDKYLIITDEHIHYAKNATQAVELAGVPQWWSKYPIEHVSKMQPGDEMSVGPNNSIFRITGKDTTLTW